MEQYANLPTSWKQINNADTAKLLIDMGLILKWSDMRYVRKNLPTEELSSIVRHFAIRLAERVGDRLSEEILVESLFIIFAHNPSDNLVAEFLEELVVQPNYVEASLFLIEISVGMDTTLMDNGDDIFAVAIVVVCELGFLLQGLLKDQNYHAEFQDAKKILIQISTYLLSVSNTDNDSVRLSLINYFGKTETSEHKPGFNRIVGRFGYTILETLYNLLFNKKTEAVSLQYLLENIPYILEGDNSCQKILHETWKFYMLKKTERFILFMRTQQEYLNTIEDPRFIKAKKVFLQHVHVLLRVASEVNHRGIGQELLQIILGINEKSLVTEATQSIVKDSMIRKTFKDLMVKLQTKAKLNDNEHGLRGAKRGRKPSFSRVENLTTINQVTYLGQRQIARAS